MSYTIQSHAISPTDQVGWEKGYRLAEIVAVDGNGDKIAYIKAAYVTTDTWQEHRATVLHQMLHNGACIYREYEENFDTCERTRYQAMQGWLLGPNSKIDMFSLSYAEFEAVKEKAHESMTYRRALKDFISDYDYLVGRAYVDYSYVNPEHRRRGIATELYKEATRFFRDEMGMVLRASGIQSEFAQAVWENFERKGWVSTFQMPNGKEARFLNMAEKEMCA